MAAVSPKPALSPPKHIQATWVDLSNISRCQLVSQELYDAHFKQAGFSQPYFILSLPYMNQPPYERVTGEVNFRPDPQPPRPLPWQPETALVFGRFFDGDQAWACCSRSFLIAQEKHMLATGLKIRIGFEMEFYLLNLDGSPVDSTGYGETTATRGKTWTVISKSIAAMQELGIPVWKYHAEAGTGQFEISIGPFQDSVLKAADSLALARQAITHVAASFDLNATFLPKPLDKAPGSSVHTNISLWSTDDQNLFEVKADMGKSFLGGVFEELPSLMAILCPLGNSYDRLQPFNFSGTFHCLGTENRKAAIRLFRNGSVITRFELRCVDGGSSPYLLLGSLIGAGLNGLKNGAKLPSLVEVDPASLPEDQRPPRLPTTLAAAIEEFAESPFTRRLYGDEMLELILRIRRGEEANWSSKDIPQESKMKLLLDKY